MLPSACGPVGAWRSLDDFVGASAPQILDFQSNFFVVFRLMYSSTLVTCWDRQDLRLIASKDTPSVNARAVERIHDIASVAHKAPCGNKFAELVNRRYLMTCSKLSELFKSAAKECVRSNNEPARS